MSDAMENDGLGPCPTPGEIRVFDGQRCRFIERELEGDKWVVLGPATMSDAVMVPETETQYEVWQDDCMVASADTLSDAQHYAAVYGQDGPVKEVTAVTHRFPGFNIVSAMLAASPSVGGWEDISTAAGQAYIIGAWPNGSRWSAAHLWWDNSVEEWTDVSSDIYRKPTVWMPPPPSVSIGSRPQEAVPTEQAERTVLADLTHAAAALVKCHDIFMRAQGGASGNQADAYNIVASKWTEWARLRGALEPALLHMMNTFTPEGAGAWDREICTGCTSSLSIDDIKARGIVSCCPDRHMVRIGDLVDAYTARPPRITLQPAEGCSSNEGAGS